MLDGLPELKPAEPNGFYAEVAQLVADAMRAMLCCEVGRADDGADPSRMARVSAMTTGDGATLAADLIAAFNKRVPSPRRVVFAKVPAIDGWPCEFGYSDGVSARVVRSYDMENDCATIRADVIFQAH